MVYGFIERVLFGALIIWTVYKLKQNSDYGNDGDDDDSTVIDAQNLWHKNHDGNDNGFYGSDGGDSSGNDGSDHND